MLMATIYIHLDHSSTSTSTSNQWYGSPSSLIAPFGQTLSFPKTDIVNCIYTTIKYILVI